MKNLLNIHRLVLEGTSLCGSTLWWFINVLSASFGMQIFSGCIPRAERNGMLYLFLSS